jgi:hypothetical protein
MKWISVKERLPEEMDMTVLLNHKKFGVFQGYLMQFGKHWASVRYLGVAPYDFKTVTHWMPLPEPPTE